MSSFLGMCVEKDFRGHLVGDTDLDFFLSQYVGVRADKDASRIQPELGEDAGVASDQGVLSSQLQLRWYFPFVDPFLDHLESRIGILQILDLLDVHGEHCLYRENGGEVFHGLVMV